MEQIIIRVLVGLVSISTVFSMNMIGANKSINSSISNTTSVDNVGNADGISSLESNLNQHNSSSITSNNVELPKKISASIPEDAEVISSKYAFTKDGKLKSLATGKTITDKRIIGTKDHPADPLNITNGEHFEPVKVSELRKTIAKSEKSKNSKNNNVARDSVSDFAQNSVKNSVLRSPLLKSRRNTNSTLASNAVLKNGFNTTHTNPSGIVRYISDVYNVDIYGNSEGAYWDKDSSGNAIFKEADGTVFARNAAAVIDVSKYQKTIDWDKVYTSGVDGAIIRVGYGWDNGVDPEAQRNIDACKRLGIPFGVYLYSYAQDAQDGANEGRDLVRKLRSLGVSPDDLTYPVYYDLENWTWSGHSRPTSPSEYQDIVASWWNQLIDAGYHNLGVYSYRNYLLNELNSKFIHDRTSWVASYSSRVGFSMSTRLRGWQYTSHGHVDGVEGNADLSAFGLDDGSPITSGPLMYFDRVDDSPAQDYNGWNVSRYGRREKWSRYGEKFTLQYELRDCYYKHGGFGRLGAPVAEEENMGGGWWRQRCQNGDVWTHGRDKKFVIQFELRDSYYNHGGFGRLGTPVAEEENMGGGWWRQHCQHGDVWTHGTDTKYVIQYELRDSYNRHRGAGWLGAPVADEEDMGDGWWRQRCQNGDVWTHGRDKKFVIQFELRDSYYNHGGFGRLGTPVAEEENMGGGWWRQHCQHGDVWTHGTDTKYVIQYELRDSYNRHRGAGWLGAPVADEEDMGDGWWRQRCQNGDVWTHGRDKKLVIMFNLRKDYYARGGFDKVGGPIEDERYVGRGWWHQRCENDVLKAR